MCLREIWQRDQTPETRAIRGPKNEKATGNPPVALESCFLRRLEFAAAAQENRLTNRRIIAVHELNADKGITAHSPARGLFRQHDFRAFHDDRDVTGVFSRMGALHIVAEDESGMQPAQDKVTVESHKGTLIIGATFGVDVGAGEGFLKEIGRNIHSLHAAAKEHFIAQVTAFAVVELKVNVGIAAYSSENRLFRDLNALTGHQQRDVEFADDHDRVCAFAVIAEDDPCLEPTQLDFPAHRNFGARMIFTAALINDGVDVNGHGEVSADLLISIGK